MCTLHETRDIIWVNGTQTFRIVVSCTDRGSLPDTGLFVYKIIDERDPTKDEFQRIAELADLSPDTGLLNNRTAAAFRGSEYWRSSVCCKDYTDLDIALAATKAITDRVNQLVSDFVNKRQKFSTTSETLTFPRAEESMVESLKNAYADAYSAYTAAQEAESAAQQAVTSAEELLTFYQNSLTLWQSMLERAQARKSEMSAAEAAFRTFDTKAVMLGTAVDAFIQNYYLRFGGYTRVISFETANYESPDSTAIGATVTQAVTGHSGTLVAWDNTSRRWWVIPSSASSTFSTADLVTISGHSGKGNPVANASYVTGRGPMDTEISVLTESNAAFHTAEAAAKLDIEAAATGTANHDSDITTFISPNAEMAAGLVSSQKKAVESAQAAYAKAKGEVQTAYAALVSAYDAVKAVCPNWSPSPAFPPTPA